ncbi:MAG: sigma factor [Verrucomicrobiales bacterium]
MSEQGKFGPRGPLAGSGAFPETRWTLVVALRSTDEDQARQALSELCGLYWVPLYSYFRQQGRAPEDAQDLTQGLFEQLISRRDLLRADSNKGRLRTFLLAAAKNLLTSEYRRETRQKRGGTAIPASLDAEDPESHYLRARAFDDLTPEKLFERQWATVTLESVRSSLAEEYASRGRARQFAVLERFLSWNESNTPYREAAVEAGLSEEAFRAAVVRMRKRYRLLLRDKIADTLCEGEDVDAEIGELFAAFA